MTEIKTETKTERECVAVGELRKRYRDKTINFKSWLSDDSNVYIGRRGRIFIDKKIFYYGDSIYKNPFTIKDYGLEKCLELYERYITEKIKNNEIDIEELRNKKLGCFCKPDQKCHADILIKLLQ